MLDSSPIRFALLVVTIMVASWLLKRFFSGWSSEEASRDSIEQSDYSEPEEDAQPYLSPPRASRPESRIQQPLEAPEPDNMMAEPARPQQDIARRIRADSQAIDVAQHRPQHRRPQRNSKPSRHRKIQL